MNTQIKCSSTDFEGGARQAKLAMLGTMKHLRTLGIVCALQAHISTHDPLSTIYTLEVLAEDK